MRKFLMAVMLVAVLLTVAWGIEETEITYPSNRSKVPFRATVSARSPSGVAKVWIVVHPLETTDYWVQPAVVKTGPNTWKVDAYFGRPGSIDENKKYEIIAVGDPDTRLKEGDVLKAWPNGRWRSQVIWVIRK